MAEIFNADDKQYRKLIKRIQAYKTPDGSIFTDEEKAIENVRRQDLYNWCQDQTIIDSTGDAVSGKVIFEWIIENIDELRKYI